MILIVWPAILAAALAELGGGLGLRGRRASLVGLILISAVFLTGSSLALTASDWDFPELIAAYLAVFTVACLVAGHVVFKKRVPPSSWLGLLLIVAGGLIIQCGD